MSGGWEWVVFAYATTAVILGGYLAFLVGRTGRAMRRRRELE